MVGMEQLLRQIGWERPKEVLIGWNYLCTYCGNHLRLLKVKNNRVWKITNGSELSD